MLRPACCSWIMAASICQNLLSAGGCRRSRRRDLVISVPSLGWKAGGLESGRINNKNQILLGPGSTVG